MPHADCILGLYSDAWENAESPCNELFNPEERLSRVFDEGLSLMANLGLGFHALQKHCEGGEPEDDTTLLLVRMLPRDMGAPCGAGRGQPDAGIAHSDMGEGRQSRRSSGNHAPQPIFAF